MALSLPALLWRLVAAAALRLGADLLPGAGGDLCAFVLLGILPGLAAAELTRPRPGLLARLAIGIAAGPLLAAVAAVALVALGIALADAARALSWAAAAAWVLAGARAPRDPDDDAPAPAVVWVAAVGLAVVLALPPLLNPYIAVRGDTWAHAAITMRIVDGGLPPEDPRFAAIAVRYVWFYNLFVALLVALRGHGPFGFMIALNVVTGFATVALAAVVAAGLWRRREAAIGAAALAVFGLNAGAWLLWPLHLVRALTGERRGVDAIADALHGIEIGSARVIYSLSAPYAHMTSFLDKLLVGSPLAYAYLLMSLHLWATMEWLRRGRRALLAWIAAAAAGMMLFHGVVGLSVIPVWVGALSLAVVLRGRLPWLPSAGRLGAAAAATLAGGLASTPYMISVASGWAPSRSGLQHRYLAPDPIMPWTLATACGVALWLARRPLAEAWRERRAAVAVLALALAAMIVFACVVRLPEENQMKFVYQVFVLGAALAAPAFGAWLTSARLLGRRAAVVVLVLVAPVALTLQGYLADPGRTRDRSMQTAPGEAELERWIRTQTPAGAIVVDRGFRDLLMVRGRRPLYLGTDKGPEWAAFPRAEIAERRAVVADLYDAAADLRGDAERLARLGRPVYVVFRPEDDALTAGAWEAVLGAPELFDLVYESVGYRVVRLAAAGAGG